jgi:hypothetical protein
MYHSEAIEWYLNKAEIRWCGNVDFGASYYRDIFDFIHVGEANVGSTTYACKFQKMIEYWRQTWIERTNGGTDIQFPFGFVQVSFG